MKTTSKTVTGKRTAAGKEGTQKASLVTASWSDLEQEAVWAVDDVGWSSNINVIQGYWKLTWTGMALGFEGKAVICR